MILVVPKSIYNTQPPKKNIRETVGVLAKEIQYIITYDTTQHWNILWKITPFEIFTVRLRAGFSRSRINWC